MRKTFATLSAILLLSACGGEAGNTEEADTEASEETEFDQQLSEEEANAALEELEAEEAAKED